MVDIDVVVFDVLGTMVDEPTGLREAIREAVPTARAEYVEELLALWQTHVEIEQARIGRGDRVYANTQVIDREAAHRIADRAGVSGSTTIERLAAAGQRLQPWPDAAAGLADLATRYPVIGLSNASRAALLRLNEYAGLRWHLALSAEGARAYKPAAEVYKLAVEAAGCAPERILMVAAHAWDLRGAQAAGLRTAYVERPVGDPPASGDRFDGYATDLADLVRQL
ncbi:haloacid dehalogenase type II [Nocardioidaceae bacterium SCSIO 66511]|nr:haloacid dehalogenase type II [Nocardioidaceae bacterium SCSIO 66511]